MQTTIGFGKPCRTGSPVYPWVSCTQAIDKRSCLWQNASLCKLFSIQEFGNKTLSNNQKLSIWRNLILPVGMDDCTFTHQAADCSKPPVQGLQRGKLRLKTFHPSDFKSRWSRVPGIETTKEWGQGRPSTDENHLTFDIWHYFYCSWWYVRKITNCPLCTNTPATPLKYEVFICNKGDLYRWWNVLMVF